MKVADEERVRLRRAVPACCSRLTQSISSCALPSYNDAHWALVCIEIPRSDTDVVCEYEVTVSSELHAQAETCQKGHRSRNDKRRRHPLESQTKTQNRRGVLKHGGASPRGHA